MNQMNWLIDKIAIIGLVKLRKAEKLKRYSDKSYEKFIKRF
jgi:hypothetical protein